MGGNGDDNPDAVWDGACSLSSLLLEYSLKGDPYLGEPARNSFVILIQLSAKFPELENCFLKDTSLELMVISCLQHIKRRTLQCKSIYIMKCEPVKIMYACLMFSERCD